MEALRKLLAITLLAFFGLPFASSLLALTPRGESNLPACCRKNGKHHCMMSMAERRSSMGDSPVFSAPLDKCPYAPAAFLGSTHWTMSGVPSRQIFFADLVSHPTAFAQTESKLRISRDRSRQKRGPPGLSL